MNIGDKESVSRTFNKLDIHAYLKMGGASVHDNMTVPEPLIGGMFSYLLGVELPGPGTMYLKQDTCFHREAPVGTKLIASVEISKLRPEKKLIDLRTTCHTDDGTLICDGKALIYLDRVDWPLNP